MGLPLCQVWIEFFYIWLHCYILWPDGHTISYLQDFHEESQAITWDWSWTRSVNLNKIWQLHRNKLHLLEHKKYYMYLYQIYQTSFDRLQLYFSIFSLIHVTSVKESAIISFDCTVVESSERSAGRVGSILQNRWTPRTLSSLWSVGFDNSELSKTDFAELRTNPHKLLYTHQ